MIHIYEKTHEKADEYIQEVYVELLADECLQEVYEEAVKLKAI